MRHTCSNDVSLVPMGVLDGDDCMARNLLRAYASLVKQFFGVCQRNSEPNLMSDGAMESFLDDP